MSKNVVYGIVIAAVLLLAVIGWALYQPANNANFPEGTDWLCQNPACATHFNMSIKELGAYSKAHFGDPVKCPKCATPALRAEQCKHCSKWFPRPHDGYRCIFCGKENPPPTEE